MKLDEPIQFYLQHKAQIDEWAALAKKTSTAADKFFRSAAPKFKSAFAGVPGEPLVFVKLDERCPKLFLHRQSWRPADDKYPRVAIGLEWNKKSVQFDTCCVGVWVYVDRGEDGKALDRELRAVLRDDRSAEQGRWKSDLWWPIWKYVVPSHKDFWNDLDGFREELIAAALACWKRDWATVDEVLARTSS